MRGKLICRGLGVVMLAMSIGALAKTKKQESFRGPKVNAMFEKVTRLSPLTFDLKGMSKTCPHTSNFNSSNCKNSCTIGSFDFVISS